MITIALGILLAVFLLAYAENIFKTALILLGLFLVYCLAWGAPGVLGAILLVGIIVNFPFLMKRLKDLYTKIIA